MASLAALTKRVSTTLRANPAPSARIGLAATAGRGSESNNLAEEVTCRVLLRQGGTIGIALLFLPVQLRGVWF